MSRKKHFAIRILVSSALLTLMITAIHPAYADEKAQALLAEADRARGGVTKGLTWDVRIQSSEDGATTDRSFTVQARGDDALVEATLPARNKGEIFLFNDRTMWFFRPGLRKPVSISPRQRLSGQAANGDIANTNYARDYDGNVTKEEAIDGQATYLLELKAKRDNITYDRIRYWISKDKKLGLKAEFLTLQGEVFKVAKFEYNNSITSGGKKVPFVSRVTITDARFPQNKSVMEYVKPAEKNLPASLFNINQLAR